MTVILKNPASDLRSFDLASSPPIADVASAHLGALLAVGNHCNSPSPIDAIQSNRHLSIVINANKISELPQQGIETPCSFASIEEISDQRHIWWQIISVDTAIQRLQKTANHSLLIDVSIECFATGKILAKPSLGNALLIDAHHALINNEVANLASQLRVSLYAGIVEMQIVRIGHVFDVRKADWHAFEEERVSVVEGAELFLGLQLKEVSRNEKRAPFS